MFLFILGTLLLAEGKMHGFQKHIDFILKNADSIGLTPGQRKNLESLLKEYSQKIEEKIIERDKTRKEFYSILSEFLPDTDKALKAADKFGELSRDVLMLRAEAVKNAYGILQENQKLKLKELKKKRD